MDTRELFENRCGQSVLQSGCCLSACQLSLARSQAALRQLSDDLQLQSIGSADDVEVRCKLRFNDARAVQVDALAAVSALGFATAVGFANDLTFGIALTFGVGLAFEVVVINGCGGGALEGAFGTVSGMTMTS